MTTNPHPKKDVKDDKTIANIADLLAPGWNTKALRGESFDCLFQLDGIPLSWFLKRLITAHSIPPSLNTKQLLDQLLKHEIIEYNNTLDRKRKQLAAIYYANEYAKIKLTHTQKEINTVPNALFLTYTDHKNIATGEIYRINTLLQLMRTQTDQNLKPLVVTCIPSGKSFMPLLRQQQNYEHLHYGYTTSEIEAKAKQYAQELSHTWSLLTEEDKISLFGTASIWNCLRYAFEFYFSKGFLYILVLNYFTFQSILQNQNIKVCVLTSQNSIFERCLNAAASKQNIPTLLIQHGAGAGSINPELRVPYNIAVFSEYYKEHLINQKVSKNNVIVTGPLIFDNLYPFLSKKEKMVSSKTGPLNVLLLTVPFVEQGYLTKLEYSNLLNRMLSDLEKIPNTNCIIKPHPRENNIEQYEQLIQNKKNGRTVIIPKTNTKELYGLMSAADIIINFSSTTAIEAMILNKPIITIVIPTFQNPLSEILHKSNATLEVNSNQNIDEAIITLCSNQKYIAQLEKNRKVWALKLAGKVDGKSANKVVNLIYSLVEKPK